MGTSIPQTGEELVPLSAGFSAKQLDDWLRSHPEGAEAFDRYYLNHEVTWTGSVESTAREERLLGIHFKDTDGIRILAWCLSDADPSPGSSVAVRGLLARRLPNGFVVDRCSSLNLQ